MIIKSIIKRYKNTYKSPLNIISTHCDNRKFEKFFRTILNPDSNVISMEDSLFGNLSVDMIVCHNKINYLDKCAQLSFFFHCPILIIDHEEKPLFIEKDIIETKSTSVYSIALSTKVFSSWNKIHNMVLPFDAGDVENVETWKNLLYQISKIPFNIKSEVKDDRNNKE